MSLPTNFFIGKGGGEEPLFAFTTHTFTNAGASGRYGPTQGNINGNYPGVISANTVVNGGIQAFTIPSSGNYEMVGFGACCYDGNSKGARIEAQREFSQGDVIKILVGQRGMQSPYNNSGHGGTFVYFNATDQYPILVAGGAGGASQGNNPNGNGSTSESWGQITEAGGFGRTGSSTGSYSQANLRPIGEGGADVDTSSNNYASGAGAGWLSNGQVNSSGCSYSGSVEGGFAPRNGGTGGHGQHSGTSTIYYGGFGGGGGLHGGCNSSSCGGGGGYSGGAAAEGCCDGQGGGGGSFTDSLCTNLLKTQVRSTVNGGNGWFRLTYLG